MTPEQIEQERAAFEAWVLSYGELPKVLRRDNSGRYRTIFAGELWAAWLARAAQSGWISVEDRLPEKLNIYFVWDTDLKGFFFAGYNPEAQTFRIGGKDITSTVTHWQPLPQPPKGDHT